MEGLILNEQTKYFTYLEPLFDSIGDEFIRSLNWRIMYPECGGSLDQCYSFEDNADTWISGDDLVDEVRKNPGIQWWWGLLQGFPKSIYKDIVDKEPLIDIQNAPNLWKKPVTMRSQYATVEIEAFDSSMTIVVSRDDAIIDILKEKYPQAELLSSHCS